MRRLEHSTDDLIEIDEVLNQVQIGHLGIITENNYPRIVPLNYVWVDGAVYFHGALDGEKFQSFHKSPRVSFSAIIPYAMIPSYWSGKEYACPATSYFKSVQINGVIKIVDDLSDKAKYLNTIMIKYQPEGGYKEITSEDPLYKKSLIEVGVFKVVPEKITMKSKFGQNISREKRLGLIDKLIERNLSMDHETAHQIRKTLSQEE